MYLRSGCLVSRLAEEVDARDFERHGDVYLCYQAGNAPFHINEGTCLGSTESMIKLNAIYYVDTRQSQVA